MSAVETEALLVTDKSSAILKTPLSLLCLGLALMCSSCEKHFWMSEYINGSMKSTRESAFHRDKLRVNAFSTHSVRR